MQEFKVPELGENVAEGDVTRVLVKVGDTIEQEQPVIELETDKATIEVPSSVAGVVKEIKVKAGDKVKVGTTVLTVDEAGAAEKAGADKGGAEQGGTAAETAKPAKQAKAAPAEARATRDVEEPARSEEEESGPSEDEEAAASAVEEKPSGREAAQGRPEQPAAKDRKQQEQEEPEEE